ncbi:hypothetical protein L596_016468 [Steinernema carpocapsae]|uniref:Uncharacterized protein n=1 Tax=Steinernema carpocapsae TaxID=34508 RepID=A0A4U5NI30_STECR|nr:hypothetical protein L596_016468 [Steinernema carpocapsae]
MEYFYQLIIGCCYLAIVIVAILLNLLLTYIVLTTKDFIRNSSFKLLVEFNVTLLLLCCVHVLTSLKTILQVDFNDIGERLIGAITNFAWMAAMALNLVIAADRFHVVVFSKHNSKKKWILFVVSVLAWLPGCILFAVDLTPNTGYVFSIVESNWIYLEGPWTAFAQTFEQCVTFPSLTGSFVLYVLIFVYIAKVNQSLQSSKWKKPILAKAESQIFLPGRITHSHHFSSRIFLHFQRRMRVPVWLRLGGEQRNREFGRELSLYQLSVPLSDHPCCL